MKTNDIQFFQLADTHAEALIALFNAIQADPDSRYFHPHPFDAMQARRICSHAGNDKYFGLECAGVMLGYGMLRGWDGGFTTPSLGIYVSPALRRTGASIAFMKFLHNYAKCCGATKVRLKVYPENEPAVRLYKSLGYSFAPDSKDDAQQVGLLDLR